MPATLLCKIFGQTNVAWKNADWKWSACGDCWKWPNTNVLWMGANWFWSSCLTSPPPAPPEPPVPPIVKAISYTGVDATTLVQPWLIEPWNPYRTVEKKKKMIELICNVKGTKYNLQKESKNLKLSVDDVQFTVNNINKINLNTTLEE